MELSILISLIGASSAILVAAIGALLNKRNAVTLRTRQLKESHYINYINAISHLSMDNNSRTYLREYASNRNNILVVASPKVVNAILEYENKAIGKLDPDQNALLTNVITAIRKDLELSNTSYPIIQFVK